ncbi:M6 family metalloprotease domain-containing protein, partial [Hathewaya proteolytica DSM 3090]
MKNKKLLSVVLSGSMLLSSLSASMTVFASEGNVFTNALEKASKVEFTGQKFTAKPLVILMDFQDYKHHELDAKESWRINAFKGSETTKEFYQNLFFGKDYYETSDGKKHITVRKFYEEESGGVYDFDGTVVGWYMAKGNAADYGSNEGDGDQKRCRDGLVKEAIAAAAKDLDLSQFDVEDKWDLDGDGNYNEPDGIIDSIVVLHPGLGEEWGGGSLGDDAIWPFRWGYNMFGNKNEVDTMTVEQKKAVIDKNPTVTDKAGNTLSLEDFTVFEQDL